MAASDRRARSRTSSNVARLALSPPSLMTINTFRARDPSSNRSRPAIRASYKEVRPSGLSEDTACSSAATSLARRKRRSSSASRTPSLNARANNSSLGLLDPANASVAATTSPIFGRMLLLLSMTSPIETGVSSLLNKAIGCASPSS